MLRVNHHLWKNKSTSHINHNFCYDDGSHCLVSIPTDTCTVSRWTTDTHHQCGNYNVLTYKSIFKCSEIQILICILLLLVQKLKNTLNQCLVLIPQSKKGRGKKQTRAEHESKEKYVEAKNIIEIEHQINAMQSRFSKHHHIHVMKSCCKSNFS